jgi:hypothetical protein
MQPSKKCITRISLNICRQIGGVAVAVAREVKMEGGLVRKAMTSNGRLRFAGWPKVGGKRNGGKRKCTVVWVGPGG